MATLTDAQRLDRFARALSADTGLTYDASLLWARAEVGSLNNLGIMSGGKPVAYATPEQGAQAAANLINTSSYYSGIRAAAKTGDTTRQLIAIAESPWHLGPVGLAQAGGIDPYYMRIFGLSWDKTTGVVSRIGSTVTSTASTAIPTIKPATGPTKTLADALGWSSSTVLTKDMATSPTILAALSKLSGEKTGDLNAYLVDFIGKPVGSIPFVSTGTGGQQPGTTVQGTQASPNPLNVAVDIGGAIIQAATFLIVAGIIALGIFLYAKGAKERETVVVASQS